MKATAIAFLIVGGYWVATGITSLQEDQTKGLTFIVLGILFLPLARYLWNKNLTGTASRDE